MLIVMLQFYSATPAPDMDEMASTLRNWGYRVLVATPNREGDLCFDEGGTEIARIRGPGQSLEKIKKILLLTGVARRLAKIVFMLRLRKELDKIHPDIVQVNPLGFAFLIPIFRRRRSVYVLDVRQAGEVWGDDFWGKFRNWRTVLKQRINAVYFYDHACFASVAAAERILGRHWEKWATIHPVGQDPSFLSYQWPDNSPKDKKKPTRFVYVGSINKVRQLELLLAAIRTVASTRRDFSVDFIGPDMAAGFYQNLAKEFGLGGIVSFLPAVPYSLVAKTVAAYDVALAYVPPLPDWQYQPTLKVLEYRALGVPILASDNMANRLIVEPGINGLLVEHSRESIARGLTRFIEDHAFLDQVANAARNLRQGRTWAESAKEYLDLVYLPHISRLNDTNRALEGK